MRRTTRFSEEPAILAGEINFVDLSLSEGKLAKRGEYPYDSELAGKVKQMPYNSLLLDEGTFLEAATDPESVHGEIVALDALGEGRKECSRVMVFGQMIIRSQTLFEGNTHIAVKPFEMPTDAVRETNAFQFVNKTTPDLLKRSGETPASLQPVGFCRFPDGMYGMVTKYDGSLITYDNLFWNEDPTARTSGRVARALGHCGTAFGALHGAGATHGDAQVKNWGADNRGARYLDLDGMRLASRSGGVIDAELFSQDMRSDLDRFAGSLTARSQDPTTSFEREMDTYFWPAYGDTIRSSQQRTIVDAYQLASPYLHGDTIT